MAIGGLWLPNTFAFTDLIPVWALISMPRTLALTQYAGPPLLTSQSGLMFGSKTDVHTHALFSYAPLAHASLKYQITGWSLHGPCVPYLVIDPDLSRYRSSASWLVELKVCQHSVWMCTRACTRMHTQLSSLGEHSLVSPTAGSQTYGPCEPQSLLQLLVIRPQQHTPHSQWCMIPSRVAGTQISVVFWLYFLLLAPGCTGLVTHGLFYSCWQLDIVAFAQARVGLQRQSQ